MIDDKDVSKLWMLLQIAEISSRFPNLKAIYKSAMDDLTALSEEHAEAHAEALAEQREKEAAEEAARQKHADGIAALKRQQDEEARQEKLAREAKYAQDVLDKEAKDAALAEASKPKVISAEEEPIARRPV